MKTIALTHALFTAVVVVLAVVASGGCGQSTGPAAGDVVGLPVALLSCPDAPQRVGQPFHVDGSASHAGTGGKLDDTLTHLKLAPGSDDVNALSADFVATLAGPATISLFVEDDHGNNAIAACRVQIDPADDDEGTGDPDPVGDDGGDPVGDVDDGGDPVGDPVGGDPVPTGAPVDLTGTFAFVGYDAPTVTGGALDPGTQCADTPAVALVTLAQSGNHVDMDLQYCRLTAPNVQILFLGTATTIVPDAIPEGMRAVTASFDLASATEGASFSPPLAQIGQTVTAGTDLTDVSAPLPTDPQSGHVFDDDHDQNPGVTITGSFGDQWETYRRTIRAFSGVIQSSDVVDGSAAGSFRVSTESAILADTNAFVPTSTGRASTFKLLRVDGGGAGTGADYRGNDGVVTCDDLRAHLDALTAQVHAPAAPASCPAF